MSKSVEGSFINLTDSLEDIRKKIRSVPTATTSGGAIPQVGGIRSLYVLYKLLSPDKFIEDFEKPYTEGRMRYETIKNNLTEIIFNVLKPIQERRKKFESDQAYINKVIKEGAEKARTIASQTVKEVRQKMGLL